MRTRCWRRPTAATRSPAGRTRPAPGRGTSGSGSLTVDREALPEGASPTDVRIYHYHGGSWTALSTTHVENDTYVATTSAFSTFAVGVATPPPATATPTAATLTATSETGPTATATPGTTSSGSGPGFGVAVALLAVFGGVVLVRLRKD